MEQVESALQFSATLIALTGLYLVWNQLKLLHRQITFQSLTHFQEIVTKPELQKALRVVYNHDPSELTNIVSIEPLEKIELILNNYDLLAWSIRKKVIPLDDVIEIEWPVLLRIQKQLGPFIKKEKEKRGGVPYKEDLTWLIEKADEYKGKHYPDLPITVIKKGV